MNNIFARKCVALLTAISTSFTTMNCITLTGFAESWEINSELEYAENATALYLSSYDVDNDSIYLSQPYSVYNLDEEENSNNLYIVFEADTIIGMLSVTEVDGEFYSSFEFNSFDGLQSVYDNNESISFVSSDEKLYVEESSESFGVYDQNNTVTYNFALTTEIELEKIHRVENNVSLYSTSVHTYQNNLLVPIVQNESINGGLCWAAAIASKVDYLNNSTYIAHDIYYILNELYGGTSCGIPLWITRGYSYFGISTTTYYRMLNCVEIYNSINSNNPIHIDLFNSSSVGHSVLISGITINADGSGIYRLVDSNKLSYVDVIVPADVMTAESNFIYATSYGYTFDIWARSYLD